MGKVLALSLLLALTACQTTGGSFCAISKPQRPTLATIEQLPDDKVEEALAALEKGRRLCGWRPS